MVSYLLLSQWLGALGVDLRNVGFQSLFPFLPIPHHPEGRKLVFIYLCLPNSIWSIPYHTEGANSNKIFNKDQQKKKKKKERNPEVQCCIAITGSIYFFFNIFFLCFHFTSYLFLFGGSGALLLLVGFLYLQCVGFSLQWLLLLQSMGSRCMSSGVVVHRLGRSRACGLFLEQGLNLCPLHWQADS